jgi:ligand-binding sensor domain-containing protein
MKRKTLFAILMQFFLLLFARGMAAQEPAYLHYSVGDGLPSALVYCAVQDCAGYMWFGTDNGLARFDGTRFKVLDMRDGLPDQEVVGLFVDSQCRLWISCFGKQPCYIKDGKIITAENDSLLAKTDKAGVYTFFEDSRRRIWLACKSYEYYCLSDSNLTVYEAPYSIHGFGEFDHEIYVISSIFIDKLTEKNSLQQCFLTPQPFLRISDEAVRAMLQRGGDNVVKNDLPFITSYPSASVSLAGEHVLFAYLQGLLLVEYKNGIFSSKEKLMGMHSNSAVCDNSGVFWVRPLDGGIMSFDCKKDGLSNPQSYLMDKKLTTIYCDNKNNIWFGTQNEGILMLPKAAVVNYNSKSHPSLRSDNITAICQLDNGALAVGDDVGNVYIGSKSFAIAKKNPFSGANKVRNIIPYGKSGWVAVSDRAFYSSNGQNFLYETIGAYKTIGASKEYLWIGTSSYLFKYHFHSNDSKVALKTRVMAVQADQENNVWAGTLEGLFSEKDGFTYNWGKRFPPLLSRIIDIKQAGDHAIWVATPDYGLVKATVSQGAVTGVEIVNEKLSTPIENIKSIYPEQDGVVWLATNKGVYSIDSNNAVINYDQTNGLASNDVNALLVDHDTLWAATVSGLSKLLLKQQGETGDFPTLIVGASYLERNAKRQLDFMANDQKPHQLTVPPGSTMLEVDMAALHFRTRGNLQFEFSPKEALLPIHQLTFGNLFRCVFGKTSNITLIHGTTHNLGANLTRGRFLCAVTAILPDGTRSTQPDHILITVLPHWWETVWFSLLLIGLAIFFVVRAFKARSAFLKLQGMASELQLQAIKSQMNPHFVGNSINAIQQFFYPPDPVKASEYISIFSDLLRRTMDFAEVDFIPFAEEAEYVKDYLEMVKLRFGDRFNYTITGETDIAPNAKFPAMLLQPILENATIHGLSPDGPSLLNVVFAQQGDLIQCCVTDNGVGIEASRLRKSQMPVRRISKGLKLLDKKVQMLNSLHPALQLKVKTTDCRQSGDSASGTQVVISFSTRFSHQPAEP